MYVPSKRGTNLILYDGNTYTPNDKIQPGHLSRSWKCSQYYRQKCKARIVTKNDTIRVAVAMHTHEPMFPVSMKYDYF